MTPPANKVDMAQMNAAIDKVSALPATTQAELANKVRSQRKAKRLPPARSRKNVPRPTVR